MAWVGTTDLAKTIPLRPVTYLSRSSTRRPVARRLLRMQAGIVTAILIVLAFFAYQAYYVVLGRNLHVIVDGMMYRSATLSERDLRQIVTEYGIRTVINLRGECPNFAWYQEECRVLDELGVKRFDVNLSSYLVPGVPEMRKLVKALDDGEYPVLIHCRRGSDRTGLASALAMLLKTDATLNEAQAQLSWRYGHLEYSRTGTLHRVFRQYENSLEQRELTHTPMRLHDWLLTEYTPGPYWAEIVPLEVPTEMDLRSPKLARFKVINRSEYPWNFKQSASSGFHLQYLLRNEDWSKAYQGGAGYFDKVLLPGDGMELAFSLPAVSKPGRYRLRVDMGEEGACWFFLVGSPCFESELVVGNPDAAEHHKKRKHGD